MALTLSLAPHVKDFTRKPTRGLAFLILPFTFHFFTQRTGRHEGRGLATNRVSLWSSSELPSTRLHRPMEEGGVSLPLWRRRSSCLQ